MFRKIAGVATLAVVLIGAAMVPPRAQDQKGTLVFAVESLGAQTLDPILEGRPGNAVYQAVMYDSLVGFDLKKGGVGPGVAERWELSADGLAWTFYLRPGQTFHNGDKLTAEEIQYLLQLRGFAEESHHCPHGRPTTLLFSRQDLDRQFRRT